MGQKIKHRRLPENRSTIDGVRPPSRTPAMAVCGFLLLAVFLAFGRSIGQGFVEYDDPLYVANTPQVTNGFTLEGIQWAFTTTRVGNWHPVTWLSLMLDGQLYGLHAWGYHLTNVVLQAATAILLFLVLWRMTGDVWPAAFAATLFAIHPLRVESVAWVAERKDVLSGLFFMLALGAYVGYVRRLEDGVRGRRRIAWYMAVVAFFALGLMSKPSLVTFPFLLLLLDYWPLGRFAAGTLRVPAAGARASRPLSDNAGESVGWAPPTKPQDAVVGSAHPTGNDSGLVGSAHPTGNYSHGVCLQLILEKLPLFALAAASCAVTPFAQGLAVVRLDTVPFQARVENALVSYAAYLGQFFSPTNLAVFYPHRGVGLPVWEPMAAFLLLAAISLGVFLARRRFPYLMVGWLWYLGTLVPMLGLMQVGIQSRADRYTYLSQIGLCIAFAWAAAQFVASRPRLRPACGALAAVVVTSLMFLSWQQTGYWADTETLWRHALDCTEKNPQVEEYLGSHYSLHGRPKEAVEQFRRAIAADPNYLTPHVSLGEILANDPTTIDEAIRELQWVLKIRPDHAAAHFQLGSALARRGQKQAAIAEYLRAAEADPNNVDAQCSLGAAFTERGQPHEAEIHFRKALALAPNRANIHYNLGVVLNQQGKTAEAMAEWREALRLKPDDTGALDQLAWTLATSRNASIRNGAEAVSFALRAVKISSGRDPALLDTLAAAYAEAGRFSEAVATAEKAISLAIALGDTETAKTSRERQKLYRASRAYRE